MTHLRGCKDQCEHQRLKLCYCRILKPMHNNETSSDLVWNLLKSHWNLMEFYGIVWNLLKTFQLPVFFRFLILYRSKFFGTSWVFNYFTSRILTVKYKCLTRLKCRLLLNRTFHVNISVALMVIKRIVGKSDSLRKED